MISSRERKKEQVPHRLSKEKPITKRKVVYEDRGMKRENIPVKSQGGGGLVSPLLTGLRVP